MLLHGATRYASLAAAAGLPYRSCGDLELFGATPARHRFLLAQSSVSYAHLRRRYRCWSALVWQDVMSLAHPDDVLLCGLGSAALARSWRHAGGRAGLVLVADIDPGPGRVPDRHLVSRADEVRRRVLWRLALDMSSAPWPTHRPRRQPSDPSTDEPMPVIHAVSQTLACRPPPRHPWLARTGHLIVPGALTASTTEPSQAFQGLRDVDRPVVHVGLGSVGDPDGRLLRRLDAAAADVGCLLVTDGPLDAAAGLEHVLGVRDADHHALFAQVSAVLHHGGAGTTITGLLAARPTATIPQLGDQFELARRVHALGAGPAPLHRQLLTPRALRRTLHLLADPPPAWRRAAEGLAGRLAAENGVRSTASACEQVMAGAARLRPAA